MSFNSKDDAIRNNCVQKLYKITRNMKQARNIEKGIYNYVIKLSIEKSIERYWSNILFKNLYQNKFISIISNLNSKSYIQNKNLLKRVKKNEIKANDLATLSVYDIFPEIWTDMIDKKTKRDKLKYELKQQAMTEMFKCRKCGSRKCSYYEIQTRSADEPMTQFINCLDCGTRWKQ